MTLHRRLAPIAAVFALLALCAGAAIAQPVVSEHRTPAGIPFRHAALPGDITHSLSFAWADGYGVTLPGKEGVAILGARLLMEGGTTAMNESARIERLKDLQTTLVLSGGAHFTRGALSAPKAKLGDAAALLAALLAEPALPADKLALIKRNLIAASRQQQTNPEAAASRLLLRLILGEGPLLGIYAADPSAYEKVEVADIDAWRRAVLGRAQLTVASAGPLTPEEVGPHIDRMFAALPAGGHAIAPKPAMKSSGRLIVLERPSAQTAIVAGGPSAWIVEPDILPGTVAVRILGSGFDSRLVKAVREGLGATYGIRAGFQQIHPAAFSMVISTAVDSGKAAAALAAIRKEYARFRADGVTEAEVAPIRTRLIAEAREQLRRAPAVAQRVRELTLAGYPIDYLATYEEQVNGLGAATVNDGIRTRFPAEPLTVVIVAPSAEGLDADCVIKSPAEIARCE
jgi:zinc protease